MAGESTATFLFDADGNIDRVRDTEGHVYYLASTLATTAAEAANAAASKADTAAANADAATSAANNMETARREAETARVEAEKARELAQQKNNADQALNNEAARNSQPIWLGSGQYDPDTLAPIIENPIEGPLYFVPLSPDRVATMVATSGRGLSDMSLAKFDSLAEAAAAGNAYVEWLWHNSERKWEQIGTSQKQVTPISTDDIDAVAGGEQKSGDSVLTLTGFSYLFVKLKSLFASIVHSHAMDQVTGLVDALAGKAASVHTHAASDIASGALPIARGGTGSGDAAGARKALGAASQADVDTIRDSVSRTVTVGSGLAGSSVWCDTHLSQRVCLTARTADRARGYALVASDTSIFLYDLDAQNVIWELHA